MNNVIYY